MRASTTVLIIAFPINLGLSIALIHHTPLELLGSPLALSITYWLSFFLLCIYTTLSPAHRRNGTWGGLQLKAVLDPGSCLAFLKLALPGILMVGTEWHVKMLIQLEYRKLITSIQGRIRDCCPCCRPAG